MDLHSWLTAAVDDLTANGIETARLDTLVLLEDSLGTDRALLLAHPEVELTNEQLSVLDRQIARRATHEPLAYIRGHSEFYGRVFAVDKNVLVPRPESETIIELLKELLTAEKLPMQQAGSERTIIDVGTGSGALAITAKLELAHAGVAAVDIDPQCLDVAQQNATTHQAVITYLQGDLLQPILNSMEWQRPLTVLLCNLPYVPDDYAINQAADHEPRLALFAGADGLDLYQRMFEQLAGVIWRPHYILTESLPQQHTKLADIALSIGYRLQATEDFIQVFQPIPPIT